jgi:hypothetical protein
MMGLAQLIGEHLSAFEYDWRSRFGIPLRDIFEGRMTWREAWSLTEQLLGDPSSHVFAAVSGWPYPWSRESFQLADLIDVTRRVAMKKGASFRPYPRPSSRTSTRSRKPQISQEEIKRLLRERGPQAA